MKKYHLGRWLFVSALGLLIISFTGIHHARKSSFRVFVTTSKAKDHIKMMAAAEPILKKMATDNHFEIEISNDTGLINDDNLKKYQVFVQLQQAPFDLSVDQQASLQRFIEQGKGWVGFHAAGLPGKRFIKPDRPYWQWYEDFLGGIEYSPHPAFQKGVFVIEDHHHPVTKDLPDSIEVWAECYEFNKSPRPNVHVLATAVESSYKQNKPMGDHPIIWTNEKYRRMVYIGIGHDSSLWNIPSYNALIKNAIIWAASK